MTSIVRWMLAPAPLKGYANANDNVKSNNANANINASCASASVSANSLQGVPKLIAQVSVDTRTTHLGHVNPGHLDSKPGIEFLSCFGLRVTSILVLISKYCKTPSRPNKYSKVPVKYCNERSPASEPPQLSQPTKEGSRYAPGPLAPAMHQPYPPMSKLGHLKHDSTPSLSSFVGRDFFLPTSPSPSPWIISKDQLHGSPLLVLMASLESLIHLAYLRPTTPSSGIHPKRVVDDGGEKQRKSPPPSPLSASARPRDVDSTCSRVEGACTLRAKAVAVGA
ncbi:hypothetical protein G7046_g7831 [Stylonectria norvegica]|nr:hypothetical protein G7046_g7831 [Stylonectria norvegica]